MDWLSASLPIWIIGAPLVYLAFDWMRTPKATSSVAHSYDVRRRAPPSAAA